MLNELFSWEVLITILFMVGVVLIKEHYWRISERKIKERNVIRVNEVNKVFLEVIRHRAMILINQNCADDLLFSSGLGDTNPTIVNGILEMVFDEQVGGVVTSSIVFSSLLKSKHADQKLREKVILFLAMR